MTSIKAIESLRGVISLQMGEKVQDSAENSLFGDVFQSVIGAVKETDAEKSEAQYLLATGQLDNPAALNIASAKAQTSVQLLVQLRNKALDSYNELMRISL